MKQNITKDQLNELSKKGKEKLREWSMELDSDFELTEENDNGLPLLSIGQMIEFLDELNLEVVISKPKLIQYEVSIYDKYSDKVSLPTNRGFYQATELCDACWEAVKEVLNKD